MVVYDGVEPIDLGGTAGVISMARRVLPAVEAIVIAAHAGPVRLAGGVVVMAQVGFGDAPVCDQYVVCGGATWPTQARDAAMLRFAHEDVSVARQWTLFLRGVAICGHARSVAQVRTLHSARATVILCTAAGGFRFCRTFPP